MDKIDISSEMSGEKEYHETLFYSFLFIIVMLAFSCIK